MIVVSVKIEYLGEQCVGDAQVVEVIKEVLVSQRFIETYLYHKYDVVSSGIREVNRLLKNCVNDGFVFPNVIGYIKKQVEIKRTREDLKDKRYALYQEKIEIDKEMDFDWKCRSSGDHWYWSACRESALSEIGFAVVEKGNTAVVMESTIPDDQLLTNAQMLNEKLAVKVKCLKRQIDLSYSNYIPSLKAKLDAETEQEKLSQNNVNESDGM